MKPICNKQMLQAANEQVNARVNYTSDPDAYSNPEWWAIAETFGDCEDYALAKFVLLRRNGFPLEQLRLACCYTELDEYHAVLLADLYDDPSTPEVEKGQTWVLDNRYPHVERFQDLPYRWHIIQLPGTNKWTEPLIQGKEPEKEPDIFDSFKART